MPTLPNHGRRRGALLAAIGLLLSTPLALAPSAAAAATLNTPFPSVVVGPGSTVGFDVTVTGNANEQISLAVSGVPADWTATLRGGGYVVNGVQTDATGKATVRLELKIPATATDSTSTVTLSASGSSGGCSSTTR